MTFPILVKQSDLTALLSSFFDLRLSDLLDDSITNPSLYLCLRAFWELEQAASLVKHTLRDIDRLSNLPCCTASSLSPRSSSPTSAYMAVHSVGKSCPLHGKPTSSSRIRSYVSAAAKESIEAARANYKELSKARMQLERQRVRFTVTESDLCKVIARAADVSTFPVEHSLRVVTGRVHNN